jgi:hypothetical protein
VRKKDVLRTIFVVAAIMLPVTVMIAQHSALLNLSAAAERWEFLMRQLRVPLTK